jgi:hypothetical protein
VVTSKMQFLFYLKGYNYIDFSNDTKFNGRFEEHIFRIRKVDRNELELLGVASRIKSDIEKQKLSMNKNCIIYIPFQ